MSTTQRQHIDLQALILRLNETHGGDTDKIMSKLMDVLRYSIKRKLLDPETLEALRAGQWPENIQKLLADEGAL
jgi:hypothetical protein